jgi:hypothetical protein
LAHSEIAALLVGFSSSASGGITLDLYSWTVTLHGRYGNHKFNHIVIS